MLYEQRHNDGLFLSVKHGALCLESKEPKEGYELIEGEVDGEPYSKYIKKFAGMDGLITKIEWYERSGTYGTFRGLKLVVKDKGEVYLLDLPYEKRPYDYFTKVAENIDFSKTVEIVTWPDREKPKQTVFAIKQDGKFIQWKYTKDDMGDCPPAKQLRSGKWNFDDQRDWLLENLINVVIPQVNALHEFDEVEPEYTGDEERAAIADEKPMSLKETLMAKAKAVGGDPNDPLNAPPDTNAMPVEVS